MNRREHGVPLSDAAVGVLKRLDHRTGSLFSAASQNSLTRLLHKMGHNDITIHGFRSTFLHCVAEQTESSQQVVVAALGHISRDSIAAPLPHDIMFKKRRQLINAGAAHRINPWIKRCAQQRVNLPSYYSQKYPITACAGDDCRRIRVCGPANDQVLHMTTPGEYGFTKACYSVNETLTVLSIGRTLLYKLVKRGELRPAKLGTKTLFYASDLAALLTSLDFHGKELA
jgi:excisionase family DNA binding protein